MERLGREQAATGWFSASGGALPEAMKTGRAPAVAASPVAASST